MKPADSRLELIPDLVREALHAAGWRGPEPVLLPTVGSTNVEAAELARDGAPDGTCVVAEEQTAGRGRLDRTWVSPKGAGLWLSYVVRPGDVQADRWTWLPLVSGLAVRDAIRTVCRVPVDLKWPNDLVVTSAMCGGSGGTRKLGGILSEVAGDAVVVGIGINVSLSALEMPTPNATSVYAEGGSIDRTAILAGVLPSMQRRLAQWRADDPQVRADYRDSCRTIGRLVNVERPNAEPLSGVVTGVDDAGHLVVNDGESEQIVTAGDAIHATI